MEDITDGLYKAINKMGKHPEIIYTDDEASFGSPYFQTYLETLEYVILQQEHTHFIVNVILGLSNIYYTCVLMI